MQLEAVTAEIRPRGDWEAVDLGLALARRDFWRCFAMWWLAILLPLVVAGFFLWDSPSWLLVLFWWWKPAASRLVLFELSRRLFGEKPTWRESLRRIPPAWYQRFFHFFIFCRLSPWLTAALAVEDLEGLRGKACRQRRLQLARRGDGAMMWIYLTSEIAACWFGLAILAVAAMFIPDGLDSPWRMAMESWDSSNLTEIPPIIMRTVLFCVMLAYSLTDVFMTGAGFGIYLNNRTWLEGWDVELAFKRMAKRLGAVAMALMGIGLFCYPQPVQAADEMDDARVIQEVMADKDFKVHTVMDRIPKERESNWDLADWLGTGNLQWVGDAVFIIVCAALIATVCWLLWTYRHVFLTRPQMVRGKPLTRPVARVVAGLDVLPESLPDDVPATALAWWRSGRRKEALGLLYRASISRVIEKAGVAIMESDTEGDCLLRVQRAGPEARPDYFEGITRAWTRAAYAGLVPDDAELERLCHQWPFAERRAQ